MELLAYKRLVDTSLRLFYWNHLFKTLRLAARIEFKVEVESSLIATSLVFTNIIDKLVALVSNDRLKIWSGQSLIYSVWNQFDAMRENFREFHMKMENPIASNCTKTF